MSTLQLRSADYALDHDGTHRITLFYVQGNAEAYVDVEMSINDGITASCRELTASHPMDEIVLEEHAEEWAEEHGGALGRVEA